MHCPFSPHNIINWESGVQVLGTDTKTTFIFSSLINKVPVIRKQCCVDFFQKFIIVSSINVKLHWNQRV